MNNRAHAFVALLAVIGLSIVFGMLLGTRLNTPQVALATSGPAPLQLLPASNAPTMVSDFADVVERAMPAVVSVTAAQVEQREGSRRELMRDPFQFFFGEPDDQERGPRTDPRIGEGSGFIISPDGYLLTNNHVVEDADRIRIGLQDGREFNAEVVGTDPSIDLALLKIDTDGDRLPSLPLGDSASLRVGQWVIAIGNPLEYEHTVTVGVVSAKQRRVAIGTTDAGVVSFIQTDAAINFGNSGGPLLDAAGNVVGINTAIRRANYAEGIGFALPVDHARMAIDQLREKGYVSRGYIGITMNPQGIDDNAREFYGLPDTRGVIVQEVQDDGPAELAGLRVEDIIRKVDGQPVKDNLDLIAKIAAHRPGDTVRVEVFRRGQTLQLDAKLTDRQEQLAARLPGPGPSRRPGGERTESSGLGITVENISRNMRDRLQLEEDQLGVLVSDVDFDTEAAKEGITPNMIVVSINDQSTRNVDEWDAALAELAPGGVAKLYVLAGNRGSYFFLRVPE